MLLPPCAKVQRCSRQAKGGSLCCCRQKRRGQPRSEAAKHAQQARLCCLVQGGTGAAGQQPGARSQCVSQEKRTSSPVTAFLLRSFVATSSKRSAVRRALSPPPTRPKQPRKRQGRKTRVASAKLALSLGANSRHIVSKTPSGRSTHLPNLCWACRGASLNPSLTSRIIALFTALTLLQRHRGRALLLLAGAQQPLRDVKAGSRSIFKQHASVSVDDLSSSDLAV